MVLYQGTTLQIAEKLIMVKGYGLAGPGFRGCVRTGNGLNEGMPGVPPLLFHIIICIGLWTVVLTAYSVIAGRLGLSWYTISFAARH